MNAAFAVTAAALMHAYPAEAGLIITEQPKVKTVFQDKSPAAQMADSDGDGFSFPMLSPALAVAPLTAAGIGAGFAAASKLDTGFDAFLDSSMCKNSNEFGVGYENGPMLGKLDKKGKKRGFFG